MVTRFDSLEPRQIPLANLDDAELARALMRGDSGAARAAWDRFSPLVRRISRRCLGPDQGVEDLVQEVFLRLFSRAAQLREPRALRAFVIAITMLSVRQELRRRKARAWLGLSGDPAQLDLRVVHPDPTARQALRRLYRILDRFGTRDRTAFVLRHVEGLSLREVSNALGVSLATTKRSLAHVRKRLLEHVGRDPLLRHYGSPVDGKGLRDP